MKNISHDEQKQIMLKMLKFIDEKCRQNGISYSLIGGSLIGAIRHRGYIPWDDDIDIILDRENYAKLKNILDEETGRYQTLKANNKKRRFSFVKLIDTYTCLEEKTQQKYDPNYGIFIDIFCYIPTSDDAKERSAHFKRIRRLMNLCQRRKINFADPFYRNMLRFGKTTISKIIGRKRLNRMLDLELNRYTSDTKYVFGNWPVYSYEKEIQLKKNTEDYIDAKFEGLTVMIFKNYDAILRTTFGDYMKLPPKSERVPHHTAKMWWKEENE